MKVHIIKDDIPLDYLKRNFNGNFISSIETNQKFIDDINEKLLKVSLKDTNILIDNIDVYCTPKFQKEFIKSLDRELNITIATSSPYVIQSLPKGTEIIGSILLNYKGWTISEINYLFFDLDEYSDEMSLLLKDYEQAIENEEGYMKIYNELDSLLHCNNNLRKLLKFDMIGLEGRKVL